MAIAILNIYFILNPFVILQIYQLIYYLLSYNICFIPSIKSYL